MEWCDRRRGVQANSSPEHFKMEEDAMKKSYVSVMLVFVLGMATSAMAQMFGKSGPTTPVGVTFSETEPNDTKGTATLVPGITGDYVRVVATFSSTSDVDWFAFDLDETKMYHFIGIENAVSGNIKVRIEFGADTTNIQRLSPEGRANNRNFRISGFQPWKGTGRYYLRLTGTPDATKPNPGWYAFGFYGGRALTVINSHEPDNTPTDAANRPSLPKDGTIITGGFYPDNDVDLYRFEGAAGDSFVISTNVSIFGLPWRYSDTFLDLRDSLGTPFALIPAGGGFTYNGAEEGHWFTDDDGASNTLSTIRGTLPYTGTYYVGVASYYNSREYAVDSPTGAYRRGGTDPVAVRDSIAYAESDRNPTRGEYGLYAIIGPTTKGNAVFAELEPNNTKETATPVPDVGEGNSTAGYPNNYQLIRGFFTATDTVDWYVMELDETKLYYIIAGVPNSTAPYPNGVSGNIQVRLEFASDTTNILRGSPAGRANSRNFRLAGFQPWKGTGKYYLRLFGKPNAAAPNPGEYVWGVWGARDVAVQQALHEPDNTAADADARGKVDVTGKPFLGAIWPENDSDYYMFTGTAGDSFYISTNSIRYNFSVYNLPFRYTDTWIDLCDSTGVPLGLVPAGAGFTHDGAQAGILWQDDDGGGNVLSSIQGVLPYTGKYYVLVEDYYNSRAYSDDSPTGAFRVGGTDPVATRDSLLLARQDNNPPRGEYGLYVLIKKPTGVRQASETLPEVFALQQNYPNPFNPSTTIQYSLPQDAQVTLEVYNLVGQKVITLVDEKQKAGYKVARWDGTDASGARVASGLYFYKLKAGDFLKVRRMLLLR